MAQDSQVPVSQSNPVIDSAVAAIQQANAQVAAAQSRLNATQPYQSGTMPQPPMPQPSLRAGLFQGASSSNLANQRPVTAAGARNKAVGMLAAQGARAIGAYFKKKEAEKQQALAMDIHRSLELQNGIDEASQISQQAKAVLADPNSTPEAKQQAQAQLQQAQGVGQKNNKLLESLLNGKNGKDIAKAYDVTFGEESKDKSINDLSSDLHYSAMQDAMKQLKQDNAAKAAKTLNGGTPQLPTPGQPNVTPEQQTRAQQFQAQLPGRMMANPAYAGALDQYNTAVKNATAVQKNAMDLAAKYHRDETIITKDQADNAAKAAKDLADNKVKIQEAGLKLQGDLSRAAATRFSAMARIQAAMINKGATQGQELIKASTEVYKEATTTLNDIDKRVQDLQKQKADIAKADSSDAKALTAQVDKQISDLQGERTKQMQLQYAANLGMTGNPQSSVLQSLILSPDYKPSVEPPKQVPTKNKPGLLQRGLNAAKKAKQFYNDSVPDNKRTDEE